MDLTMFSKIRTILPLFAITLLAFAAPSNAQQIKQLRAKQMHQMISSGDVVIIDNRPSPLFEMGHIPHALNMEYFEPNSAQNVMTKDMLEPFQDKTIIFYCSKGYRAHNAARQAIKWGVSTDVFWLKEGWPEWQAYTKSTNN